MNNVDNVERHMTRVALTVGAFSLMAGMGGMGYWMLREANTLWEKALAASVAGGGALGVASYLNMVSNKVGDKYRVTVDLSDQVEVQKTWMQAISPPPPAPTGAQEETGKPEGLPEISWTDFVKGYINKPELKPHIGIFGNTGTGKTWLAEAIGDLRAQYYIDKGRLPRKIYLSPTCAKDKHEFLGWELIGEGFNLGSMSDFSNYLRATLYERYQEDGDSQEPIIITPDEYRWTASKVEGASDTISDVLSIGRKRLLEIILVAPTYLVKTLKVEGEGQLRASLVMILKGELMLERVRVLERDGLFPEGSVAYLTKLMDVFPYNVCLCDDRVLMVPNLSKYRDEKVAMGITYAHEPPVLSVLTPARPALLGVQKKGGGRR